MFLASAELAAVTAIEGKLPSVAEYMKYAENIQATSAVCLYVCMCTCVYVYAFEPMHIPTGHLPLLELRSHGRLHGQVQIRGPGQRLQDRAREGVDQAQATAAVELWVDEGLARIAASC